ncbi:MAG: hypothetical protein GY898_16150 [Proteobacteria bacterium]|nr:hypothetical protein [Pseudomonadota bacterium]
MPAALADFAPWIVGLAVAGVIAMYFATVLRDEDDLKAPRKGLAEEVDKSRARAKARSSRRQTAARAPKAPPKFRPPPGSVASDNRQDPSDLLRVLEDGPEFQRQSAAKALSVPFAGSCNPRVSRGLSEVVRRTDVSEGSRASAYCALRTVMGMDLAYEDEIVLHNDFAAGADLDWLEKVEADL